MAKIPIPFVGGAEGPRRPSPDKGELETPYHPGEPAEEAPSQGLPGLAQSEERVVSEPIRIEVVDLDEAGETAQTVKEGGAGDLEGAAAAAAETGISSAAPQDLPDFLTGPDGVAEVYPESQEVTAKFRAASDDTLRGVVRLETAERLERTAEDLLRGKRGDWIRTLIADLRPQRPEVAVPRAFAAGFLAARAEEEKS
ncbi:MAG: hypothetical protein JSU87_16720 [Gemmatimonadota bacterium]|nr:MAG: hypothetical protein JSU87_16720 [Gemmatimonadota bacterium]